jgi:hypothetical protein
MLLVSWIVRLLIVLTLMEVVMMLLQSRRRVFDNVERLDFWSQIFYLQQQQL